MNTFVLCDAHPLKMPTGRSVVNLRELLMALRDMPGEVLAHHMFRFTLDSAYDFSQYGHELAYWAEVGLQDSALAERLGNYDPYGTGDIDQVRVDLLEIVEEHLFDRKHIPWARAGRELHLSSSILVAYPIAGAASVGELAAHLRGASRGTLHFHFFEARARLHGSADDFSTWVEACFGMTEEASAIRSIDFPAMRAEDVRDAIVSILDGVRT